MAGANRLIHSDEMRTKLGRELLKQKSPQQQSAAHKQQQQPEQQPWPKASPSAQALTWHIEWHSYSNTAISKQLISQPRHFLRSLFWGDDTKRSWNPRHKMSVSKGTDPGAARWKSCRIQHSAPLFHTISKHSWPVVTQRSPPKQKKKVYVKWSFAGITTIGKSKDGGLGWSAAAAGQA